LEQRLSRVESELDAVKRQLTDTTAEPSSKPWWEQWFGAFKDDQDFESAMERGAEIRRSQPVED